MKRIDPMARSSASCPPDYDVDTHFKPRYYPWDQRLCLVPDGDLFKAIRDGQASVVTDQIDTFTETGMRLRSGAELEADVVVTATGLNLLVLGGIALTVDGRAIDFSQTMSYKGMMFSGVPNLALDGYTNASWTLKADLMAEYVCRLLNHMDAHGYAVRAARSRPLVPTTPFSTSPRLRAALAGRASQAGLEGAVELCQNYARDLMMFGALDDGAMEFSAAAARSLPSRAAPRRLRSPAPGAPLPARAPRPSR